MNRRHIKIHTGIVKDADGEFVVVHTAVCLAEGCRWDYPTPDKVTAEEQAAEHRRWHAENAATA